MSSFYLRRISLPGIKFAGSLRIKNSPKLLPVQERFVKFKTPSFPVRRTHALDRIEARSARFTELQSYWTIPMSETATVAALAVNPGVKSDGSDDEIHVLTTNPLSIFTMTKESERINEISIQGLIIPERGNRPRFSIASDNFGSVFVHEETVSITQRFFNSSSYFFLR